MKFWWLSEGPEFIHGQVRIQIFVDTIQSFHLCYSLDSEYGEYQAKTMSAVGPVC
jgi:hypothetical protein